MSAVNSVAELAIIIPVYNEPGIAETLQGLYAQEHRSSVHHYIIDNGSTDNTRALVRGFERQHDDFPVTVLEEEQKGTGAAADTGFRQAILDGHSLVARTDGDTVPQPNWTSTIIANFAIRDSLQLLGGRSTAMRDESLTIMVMTCC